VLRILEIVSPHYFHDGKSCTDIVQKLSGLSVPPCVAMLAEAVRGLELQFNHLLKHTQQHMTSHGNGSRENKIVQDNRCFELEAWP